MLARDGCHSIGRKEDAGKEKQRQQCVVRFGTMQALAKALFVRKIENKVDVQACACAPLSTQGTSLGLARTIHS